MTFTVGLDMNMRIFIPDHSTFQLTIYAWLKKSFLYTTISDILFTDCFVVKQLQACTSSQFIYDILFTPFCAGLINRIYMKSMIHFQHRRRAFTI